jgi:hypothetical protein
MPVAWRFFVKDGEWYWERKQLGDEAATRSSRGYPSYEESMAAAQREGYTFTPSQTGSPRSASLRQKLKH